MSYQVAPRCEIRLELAGVRSLDEMAATWLSSAIEGARSNFRATKKRPRAADHNALLGDIEKKAKKLTKRIERLRRYPASWRAFWRSPAFGPVRFNRVELAQVVSALESIERAAKAARDDRKGRRPEVGKQHVVDLALAFFVRFSPHRPSGTPTGTFAAFAQAFYKVVTGLGPDQHGELTRQIRQAVKRHLPIERERIERKSAQKSRHPS